MRYEYVVHANKIIVTLNVIATGPADGRCVVRMPREHVRSVRAHAQRARALRSCVALAI